MTMNLHRKILPAAVLLSAWLMLLMTGYALGGWVHLVLLTAVALFPWRDQATRSGTEARGVQESSSEDSSSTTTPDDTTQRI